MTELTFKIDAIRVLEQLEAPKGAAVAVKEMAQYTDGPIHIDNTVVPKVLIKNWSGTVIHLAAQISDLSARIAPTPDFEAVKDLRISEMTPAQQDDALELWIRNNVITFNDYYREKVDFLLKRLDAARGKL